MYDVLDLTIKEYKALETIADFDCNELCCTECPFACRNVETKHHECIPLKFSHLLKDIDSKRKGE